MSLENKCLKLLLELSLEDINKVIQKTTRKRTPNKHSNTTHLMRHIMKELPPIFKKKFASMMITSLRTSSQKLQYNLITTDSDLFRNLIDIISIFVTVDHHLCLGALYISEVSISGNEHREVCLHECRGVVTNGDIESLFDTIFNSPGKPWHLPLLLSTSASDICSLHLNLQQFQDDWVPLLSAFKKFRNLHKLKLTSSEYSKTKNCPLMFTILSQMTCSKKLLELVVDSVHLSQTNINLLKDLKSLESLYLSNTDISHKQASKIICRDVLPDLKRLHCSSNEDENGRDCHDCDQWLRRFIRTSTCHDGECLSRLELTPCKTNHCFNYSCQSYDYLISKSYI